MYLFPVNQFAASSETHPPKTSFVPIYFLPNDIDRHDIMHIYLYNHTFLHKKNSEKKQCLFFPFYLLSKTDPDPVFFLLHEFSLKMSFLVLNYK